MRGGHELDLPFSHDVRELVDVDAGVVFCEADVPERRARSLAHQLPRHQVGVMLEDADHDFIPRPEVFHPPGVRHQVDRLARVAREDNLAIGLGVDEVGHLDPGFFVRVRGFTGEVMDPSVDVRVVHHVVVAVRVDHLARLLGRRRAVEVYEALAGLRDVLLEDGEIGAELRGEVDGGRRRDDSRGGGGSMRAAMTTRGCVSASSRLVRRPGRGGGSRGRLERRAGGE